MSSRESEPSPLPPYSYVPGGPWPHPRSSPLGHSHDHAAEQPPPVMDDDWAASKTYLRGVELFNAGYYWEAHEAWEALWHAHGRRGPTATVLKGLIKMAAAGVKAREGRPDGVAALARRAAEHFVTALSEGGERRLGLDLTQWIMTAGFIATSPPATEGMRDTPARPVFSFRIRPHSRHNELTVDSSKPDV